MCSRLLIFLCFFSTPIFTWAQNEFKAGVIGGITTSQVDGDNYGGFHKLGVAGGFFTNIYFSDKVGAEIEVLYIQKGSRKTPTKNDPTVAYYLNLAYAEIPVLAKFKTKQVIIEVGPSFGRLLSSSEEDVQGTIPKTEPFKDWEISLNLGLAYPFDDNFDISVRLSSSIIPIRNFNIGSGPLPDNYGLFDRLLNRGQYNTVLSFLARYQF